MNIFEFKAGAHVHFVGIGGIGMSGLAEVLHQKGFRVSGSDISQNANVKRLQKLGIQVFNWHDASYVQGADCVVLSSAIQPTNLERAYAEQHGMKVVHRADILAEIMTNFRTIAITGTHGKTSTTALMWTALKAAGFDCGLINGGVMAELETNAQLPAKADGWLVVEADESDQSFTKLAPTLGVITNIEPEHMENYGDEAALIAGFQTFVDHCNTGLYPVVVCGDDARVRQLSSPQALGYGAQAQNDICVQNIQRKGWPTSFTCEGALCGEFTVNLPGAHYAYNSAAVLAVVQALGGDVAQAASGLASFQGVARRFTKVGDFQGATVVDDYGHHPTEIAATIEAAKGVAEKDGKVIAIVQPHKYTRLKDNWDGFTTCMKAADIAYVLPVYAAGQKEEDGVNSQNLAQEAGVTYIESEAALVQALTNEAAQGDVILFLGAGDSTLMAGRLVKRSV